MEKNFNQMVTFLKEELEHDSSGHSLDHALRVYNMATILNKAEGGNSRVIKISALVHDVIDPKLFDNIFEQKAKLYLFLQSIGCSQTELEQIFYIIENISYKGGNGEAVSTLEAQIVQDADRLDAIGAIGIGRTFMYGATHGTKMYEETLHPTEFKSEQDYREHKGTILNHFDEKLFKLKDLMNTTKGQEIANQRHTFMRQFVEQFKQEWNMEK